MRLMRTIRVDHLLRKGNTSQNVGWVRPEHDDIQEVKTDYQVIPCNVNGDWVDLNSRVPKFKVNNTKEIWKLCIDFLLISWLSSVYVTIYKVL